MKFYFGVYFELVICNVCVSVYFNFKLGIFNNEERKKIISIIFIGNILINKVRDY